MAFDSGKAAMKLYGAGTNARPEGSPPAVSEIGYDPHKGHPKRPELPKERALTADEIAMIKKNVPSGVSFPVDWSKVRLKPSFFEETSVALGYDVHMQDGGGLDKLTDFSKADVKTQALFIHEMTHVYLRAQIGLFPYLVRGVTERTYDYKLTGQDRFSWFGMEQQAAIVEDFFLMRNGEDPRNTSAHTKNDIGLYEPTMRALGIQ
jgi:hypothetical protein